MWEDGGGNPASYPITSSREDRAMPFRNRPHRALKSSQSSGWPRTQTIFSLNERTSRALGKARQTADGDTALAEHPGTR